MKNKVWLVSNKQQRGHPRKLTFLSSPMTSKHSAFSFHRSFSLWTACYPEEIRLEKSYFGGRHFETALGQAVFTWYHSVRVKIGGKEKTCNWLWILHKVSKVHIFQAIIHLKIFTAIISEFGACLAQNNPWPRVVVKRLDESHFGQSDVRVTSECGLAAEYCWKWLQRCRVLGFFEDGFPKEKLQIRELWLVPSCVPTYMYPIAYNRSIQLNYSQVKC